MIPYKSIIQINKEKDTAIYLQLTSAFIGLIKDGTLISGAKLPSSRTLSQLLEIHRKTVLASYEELQLQGWITTVPQKGTFVSSKVPIIVQKDFLQNKKTTKSEKAGFSFYKNKHLIAHEEKVANSTIYINDGIPDTRLAPLKELAIIYRNVVVKKNTLQFINYGTAHGNKDLRKNIAKYLNETRGLKITKDNVLITRGSQMGIYLSAKLILKPEDIIVVGDTNYISADRTFLNHGASIKRIPVDNDGLCISSLKKLCSENTIKAIYITSHHHHPTTVTLSAERRIKILQLAEKYKFAILEDDYDYDFHYNHSPILPLASHDCNGNVIYLGSICKSVAPVFRVGYMIATKDVIDEAATRRKYMDRQGDALLEITFSKFIASGDLQRHTNKVLKIYKERRDFFCKRLKEEVSEFIKFEIPNGGMAVWVQLNKKYNWGDVSRISQKYKLVITDWKNYDPINSGHNGMRFGFASYTIEEIQNLVLQLKKTFLEVKKLK
ncbi:GntR family transcriptional regulator/MocR family aminotransferase [Maribacter vaceletii]|uniref:GntR family transcriptional regulator/MocR family aminotransferase n=1 Tax=Maribacter vaceletii TaxID=1206816 RepID=A0A495EDU0_9FLAO|nr:PLP-dependent aminotransferase family protein [Maribacter vaceletii]RKR14811.1 GntR family transcriptional regulator/MocR family aminotransferase [Maribacter vaceletii]